MTGFQVANDGGVLSIDGNFANLALRRQQSIQLSERIGLWGLWTNWVGYTSEDGGAPILAVRPHDSDIGVLIAQVTRDGNNWSWQVAGCGTGNYAGQNRWVEVYIYDKPPAQSGSRYGLQVFNESSQLVFDSNFKYAEVLGSVRTNGPDFSTTGMQDVRDYGARVSFCPGIHGATTRPFFPYPGFQTPHYIVWDWGVFGARGTALTAGWMMGGSMELKATGTPPPSRVFPDMSCLVLKIPDGVS